MKLILWVDERLCSPWALSVWAALLEKGLTFEIVSIDLRREDSKTRSYRKNVWTEKVPALQCGNLWIPESLAILEYLEDAFPNQPRLFPTDPIKKAQDRAVLSWLRSDLTELRRCMPFESLYLKVESPIISDQARSEANDLLVLCETRLRAGEVSEDLMAVDLELGCALRRLIHHGYDLGECQAIRQFADRIWHRSSIQSWARFDRPVLESNGILVHEDR